MPSFLFPHIHRIKLFCGCSCVCLWILIQPRIGAAQSEENQKTNNNQTAEFKKESPAKENPSEIDPASKNTDPKPEDPNALTPPKLIQFVEATYPENAADDGVEKTVDIEFTIEVDGSVTDPKVLVPVGNGFDEAALEAVQQFRFEPAKQGGVPIAARIQYRYVFELKTKSEVQEETGIEQPPEPGRIEGRVLASDDEMPISGAEVTLIYLDAEEQEEEPQEAEDADEASTKEEAFARSIRQGVTNQQGEFRFENLLPGQYEVNVITQEYGGVIEIEEVGEGEVTTLTYRIQIRKRKVQSNSFGATAVVDPPPREVIRRTIPKEQLTRIPGTRGDALRTVELLPGVARPPFGVGALIVRGSSPQDSETYLNGIPVPLLYHFGGLTSFINSRLLERIDFYPGNFSTRYGRKIGGVLEVASRDPAIDRFRGVIEFSLIDASIFAETPIGDEVSVAAGFRRSMIDLVFEYLVPSSAFNVLTAPVYYDYQFFLTWKPTKTDRVRFVVYGSSDQLKLILSDPSSSDPNIRGNFNLSTQFHGVQASWLKNYTDAVEQEITLAFTPTFLDFGIGPALSLSADFYSINARAEWRAKINSKLRLIGGLDISTIPFTLDYIGGQPAQGEGTPDQEPLSNQDTVSATRKGFAYRPAFYVESDVQPLDNLRFVLGLRLDWYREIEKWSFDPRFVGILEATDQTKIKAGVGLFSQPPEFQESDEELGNPDLKPIRSMHAGLGVEHSFIPEVSAGVETFYKYLWNRIVSTDGGRPPFFTNNGLGRIYGAEFQTKVQFPELFFGYLSYTISRSERKDGKDQPWRLFDFDQTHILTASGVWTIGSGWELGGTFRLVSGNPDTPIIGGVLNADTGLYSPVYGEINSTRSPLFHRLDVRVEKQWKFDYWKLAAFLDIQNIYNQLNPEGTSYNYDYTQKSQVSGLPIIPAIGVRGEI